MSSAVVAVVNRGSLKSTFDRWLTQCERCSPKGNDDDHQQVEAHEFQAAGYTALLFLITPLRRLATVDLHLIDIALTHCLKTCAALPGLPWIGYCHPIFPYTLIPCT